LTLFVDWELIRGMALLDRRYILKILDFRFLLKIEYKETIVKLLNCSQSENRYMSNYSPSRLL